MRKTINELMRGVEASGLPKTYHDAICVSRELGFNYVRIDSLCIIRDDHQDWEHEPARMAAAYEGADLTIAVAWGADGGTGCFQNYVSTFVAEFQEQNDLRDWVRTSTGRLLAGVTQLYQDLLNDKPMCGL